MKETRSPETSDWGKAKLNVSRREALAGAASATLAAPVKTAPPAHEFRFCMNTSTLSGHKLGIVKTLEVIAKAGYTGVEPWIREIDEYTAAGHSLKDLRKRLEDLGLRMESCIGFFDWIVDDDLRRAKALEEARRNFDLVSQLGGKYLAAPPAGATDRTDLDLNRAAERYRVLIDLGQNYGVVPEAEVWGFSKTLGKLSDAAFVAIQSGHPKACILGDIYHFHKGGTHIEGLRLLRGSAIPCIHMNDYPADPPRATITDAHRVFPGDGIAPFPVIFSALKEIGFKGALSLELFNREYWKQDPLVVARTGLAKMKRVVAGG